MKCLYCQKDIISVRATKKFCSSKCKLAYHRKSLSVSKIVPVSVSKDTVSDTVKVSVSVEAGELKFRKDQPISERIEKYKSLYPDTSFVPNWIAHGFDSKEEAINETLKFVRQNTNTSLGLGTE